MIYHKSFQLRRFFYTSVLLLLRCCALYSRSFFIVIIFLILYCHPVMLQILCRFSYKIRLYLVYRLLPIFLFVSLLYSCGTQSFQQIFTFLYSFFYCWLCHGIFYEKIAFIGTKQQKRDILYKSWIIL